MSNHPPDRLPARARLILGAALPRAGRTILLLARLMLPISLGVALLRWTGMLERLGAICAPAMALFRLPGEAAVALLSGYLAGIYALLGAMAMLPLSATSVTILGAIALVGHNLIIECAVQDRAGTPWWWMLGARVLTSLLVGACVAWSLAALEALGMPALWPRNLPAAGRTAVPVAGSLLTMLAGWGREASLLMLKVVLVVTAMMVATEWMRQAGWIRRMERGALPILRLLGLRERVAFPWLTAQILGVTFGSGLLIEELRERQIGARDVRALHTSIGISHSLLEDTILLVTVGASLFWIIVPRIVAASLAVRLSEPLPWGLRSRDRAPAPGGSGR